jgi:hypothetical protein
MLSQKLLVDVGVDLFAGRNQLLVAKSTRPALIPPTSLLSAPQPWHQIKAAFSTFFTLKTRFLLVLRSSQIIYSAVPRRTLSDQLASSDLHGD